MLAAELDERELFELMLVKGGNPKQHYHNPLLKMNTDCWSIARIFDSQEVKNLLETL